MSISTIRLWQLISPTLPVGGYSFSQGLEYAVHSGDVDNRKTASQWIVGILHDGLANNDLPCLLRLFDAHRDGDSAAFAVWSRRLLAARETAELRFEDVSMGTALARLLRALGIDTPQIELPFAATFSVACSSWGASRQDAAAAYAWSWSELQVAAAIKLVPLGHTEGQKILFDLGGEIQAAVETALACPEEAIGTSLPGLAIASANHEILYSRLFRS